VNAPSPHERSHSQPLSSIHKAPVATPKRARAPSDPFLDTPALSHSLGSTLSQSSGNTTALLSSTPPDTGEPPSPTSKALDRDELVPRARGDFGSSYDEVYLRIWTSPDLPNPEYLSLLKLFPTFISRRAMPRFPHETPSRRLPDIEAGDEEGGEGTRIRIGKGSMWVGMKERADGWKGGWWTRFMMWLRNTFC
jgi:hypothetical protein